jgi:hypothetical protein
MAMKFDGVSESSSEYNHSVDYKHDEASEPSDARSHLAFLILQIVLVNLLFTWGFVMAFRLLSCFFLCCFLMVNTAHAAVATYTLSGGTIDGTLNGVSFTGANFTITADADPANFVPGTVAGFPLLSQPAVSTMTIDGFAPFQITTANLGPILADVSSLFGFGPGTAYGGFAFLDADNDALNGIIAVGPLSNLSSNVTVTGDLVGHVGYSFTTTAGDLIFSDISGAATFNGDFLSSAVPEPTSMAIFGLGAFGMAYRARRKNRDFLCRR